MDIVSSLDKRLGKVSLSPASPITAGHIGQWTFNYTVGDYGIDDGGVVKFVQRAVTDMQWPQFDQADQPAFVAVETDGDANIQARFVPKGHVRPWFWCIVITVNEGALAPGDTIKLTLGDRSKGSVGIRAQTFVESGHEFRFLVDPYGSGMFQRLPSSPIVTVQADNPCRLVCIVASDMVVGERRPVFVRAEDAWSNPIPVPGVPSLSVDEEAGTIIDNNQIEAIKPGTVSVSATVSDLSCRSNPVKVHESKPGFRRFWGDLHAQTASTIGTGSDEEYFRFARDAAVLDFVSHQANDFQVTDQDWQRLGRVIKTFNQPGKFVVLPGYEWSGNTSAGGDHNVIYCEDDQPIYRSSHWMIPEVAENELSPAHPIDQLYKRLRAKGNALLIPHIGGRPANIHHYFDDELTPAVEIVSCWGIFEWLLWEAFDLGRMVGVVCNSDGHQGRPGAEGPGAGIFNIQGGLTCVLAKELTRESVFDAIKNRHCYGTTGPRIGLRLEADGRPMGSIIKSSGPVDIQAEVMGTAPIESLVLFKGCEPIKTVKPMAFQHTRFPNRIRVSWQGALRKGRSNRAVWNGKILLQKAQIKEARTFAFDSASDGISEWCESEVNFLSSTAGDVDGVDLFLDQAQEGRLTFKSLIGTCSIGFEELKMVPRIFYFGGIGLQAKIERYPDELTETRLSLGERVEPEANTTTPFFVKAIQEDGHMAWSSPVYVRKND
ncbi:MAG: DUF3604 domain-containing protein [Deltaproteobacteria bacterium]|nr:DUF3604 domain-containing protein [Deltaproteobacteria bacterium]